MDDTDHVSPRNADSADNPVSHLLCRSSVPPPEYSADESPASRTRPVREYDFMRTWLATSTDLRLTGDPTNVEWGIHWTTPVSIILLLLVGTATAIAHHVFYVFLNDTIVGDEDQQRWTLWIGSGLSFLTKVSLTAAVGISRTQWVWLTLRTKWLTLDGIDALFGIISDPALFLNWTMMKQAKVATIMAVGMWMFPLTAILTPGTISVRTVAHTETVSCSVPSFMFGLDHNSTGIIPAWNTLPGGPARLEFTYWGDWNETGGYGLGFGTNDWIFQEFLKSLSLPVYTGTITSFHALAAADSLTVTTLAAKCGANCTYTIEFLGPAMACTPFTAWSKTGWPTGEVYMDRNSYRAEKIPESPGFIVGISRSLSHNTSAIFNCTPSVAHYTVQHIIEERHFLEPVITKAEMVEVPNFHEELWRSHRSTFPLYEIIYGMVMGKVRGGYKAESQVLHTILSKNIYTNHSNIGTAIERMAQTMVVSMLPFNYVIRGKLHVLNVAAIQETNCTTTANVVIYAYSAGTLLLVYGLAVAAALATAVAGFIALGHNGMASTKSVSTIICTSRNRTLDEYIVGGDCLGGDIMSSELKRVELQFGALKTGQTGTALFALGVKGEIYPIKRD